ncbi:hypothetical protein J6590_029217 [Homalodisca vitripennis]|nr:hypothetical protein J6590_029217 [Homalodisca vitripennis]
MTAVIYCRILTLILACAMMVNHCLCNPSATVSQGRLSGSWMTTRGGRRIAAFRGVPYAAPPVGQLRFQSPKQPQPWSGVRQAREVGNKCIQYSRILGLSGEEDCLYLNIYTPNLVGSRKLPVLFFIHGGAFKIGSGGTFLHGPHFLLDEDIVLVTINYRLGVFGFLTLEDSVLPGNLGLKDQRAALRWVQENIEHFGGDPAAVTLFGNSAGASSVHHHMLFNSEEGLFRAGICHSGTALSAGGFQRPGAQRPLVNHIVNQTGCPSEDSTVLVDCLRRVRPFRLLRIVNSFFPPHDSLKRNVELSPVIEPDCVEDAFVTSDPWTKTFSMPMIIGTNRYESLFTIADYLKDETDRTFEEFNRNYDNVLPYNLMIEDSTTDPIVVSQSLKKFYLKDQNFNREHVLQLVDLLSDGLFNYGTSKTVMNNLNNSYLFSFNYLGSKSLLNLLGYNNVYGPTHLDELFLFFPFPLRQAERDDSFAEADEILSKRLIKIWTNFVTNLEPTPEVSEVDWNPVSSSDMQYLNISDPFTLRMESNFYKDRMDFWDTLSLRDKPLAELPSCFDQGQ